MPRPSFGLYDLVWVQHELYGHVGEVLSRPTPELTLMVRMVPGEPGTLKEMPIAQLRLMETRIHAIQYAIVEGRTAFPIDMLRYENAAPLNFDPETKVIDPRFGHGSNLVLARAVNHKWKPWTSARWASFGWQLYEPFTSEPWPPKGGQA